MNVMKSILTYSKEYNVSNLNGCECEMNDSKGVRE